MKDAGAGNARRTGTAVDLREPKGFADTYRNRLRSLMIDHIPWGVAKR